MADLSMYLDKTSGNKFLWGGSPIYSPEQRDLYLQRIGLNPSTISTHSRNLQLLTEIHLAHHLNVPFETTRIHIKDDSDSDDDDDDDDDGGDGAPVGLNEGLGMSVESEVAFRQIVEKKRGGYCFSTNGPFASLLRSLGYKVSEFCARVFLHRNQDPNQSGWDWAPLGHECLVVDIPMTDEEEEVTTTVTTKRFLVDVGFGGGGCMYPIELIDRISQSSLTKGESFTLKKEPLPGANPEFLKDIPIGWTVYRNFDKTDKMEAFSSPLYHFEEISRTRFEFKCLNFYHSNHPHAPFVSLLTVSLLLPTGSRRTLLYSSKMRDQGRTTADLYEKDGMHGEIVNKREVDLKDKREFMKVLEKEFGFGI